MANVIKYKGALYQRVDSFNDEAESIDNELESIIKKAKAASAGAAKLAKAKTSQEVVEAIKDISTTVETIQGWSCRRILEKLKKVTLENNLHPRS